MDYCDFRADTRMLAAFDGLPRHALHAGPPVLSPPRTREPVTIESPLPEDLVAYIKGL